MMRWLILDVMMRWNEKEDALCEMRCREEELLYDKKRRAVLFGCEEGS